MLGYAVGLIPPVRDFVTSYIDVILLVAVLGTVLFIAFHYFRERANAKKARLAGDAVTDHAEAEALVLDRDAFTHPHPHHAEGETPKA
jgi:membrane-associated protein